MPRLNQIYTRTGDKGNTSLGNGETVSKDHLRIECLGSVDELNSVVGIILAEEFVSSAEADLIQIQHDLFNLGGEMCIPGTDLLDGEKSRWLEKQIDQMNLNLAPLEEFVLPGGCKAASHCHLARTVCRRAERCMVRLRQHEDVSESSIRYINRLSDYFFVLARSFNRAAGEKDVLWEKPK